MASTRRRKNRSPSVDTSENLPLAATTRWKRRLIIIRNAILECMQQLQAAAGENNFTHSKLKILSIRFLEEIREHTEKLTDAEINDFSELQIEAEVMAASNTNSGNPVNHMKLPKLELPKFDGNILKWKEFWDRFQASIDSQNLSNAEKLAYLLTSLTDEASDAVRGIDTTNDNYEVAVQILKDRYGKPGLILDAHYVALANLKKATSPKHCLDTFNDIERHLRILEAMGEDTNHNYFKSLILNKFPDKVIQELRRLIKTEDTVVDKIRKELQHIITTRALDSTSNTTPMSLETLHIHEKKFHHIRKRNQQPTKQPTTAEPPKKKHKILSCIFCNGDHYNDNCMKVTSLELRKKKIQGRCFICFKPDHRASSCGQKKKCYHCGQFGRHNRALCDRQVHKNVLHTSSNKSHGTVLQTAVAYVKSHGELIKCRILFDTGSQRSYITKSMVNIIKPEIVEKDHLLIYTFGQEKPKKYVSPRTTVDLVTLAGCVKQITVNIVPFISRDIPCIDFSYQNEQKITLADDGSMGNEINILIGNDYYFNFIRENKMMIEENLHMIETDFGWVCGGQIISKEEPVISVITYMQSQLPENNGFASPDLPIKENEIKQLWELDSIGITDSPKTSNEEEALKHFNDTVTCKENRYQVKWPWVQYPPQLQSNYGLALGRLTSLIRRLDQDTLINYNNTIREQQSAGIIEEIDNHLNKVPQTVHYLPHHCVVKKDSTTKLRIVYDASAKTKSSNLSLNECMYKGPLMLIDLLGLLLRFRLNKIGIISDIEKAFLQLELQREDRDVTRFLWPKDITQEVTEDNLKCYRFCRVPFGIVSSPFLLNATIRHHFLNCDDEILKKSSDKIYVDNLILGTDDDETAKCLFHKIHGSLQTISMNARQWNSNSEEFLKEIPADLRENKNITKVLGLLWNIKKDTLQINPHVHQPETTHMTMRKVLQEIASVYDPCGFITPMLLPAKLLLQNLWKIKMKWDTKLPDHLTLEWQKIKKNLKDIQEIEITRYTETKQSEGKYELHCFTDASKDAYAAVVYLKSQIQDNIYVSLLVSKAKLTPLKDQDKLQIPRLELLGTLIGSRLLSYVKQNITDIPIANQYLWTDSQIVISWLRSEKLLPPFVSRRVQEINKKEAQILYVESNKNPADIATRTDKMTPERKQLWFEGPEFLRNQINYQSNWASTRNLCAPEGLMQSEDQENNKEFPSRDQRQEIDISQPDDINNRIKQEQMKYFPDECAGRKTDMSRNLGIFQDENNILRCKARIVIADLPYEQNFPILLPKDSTLTEEIITSVHQENYHVGVTHTLSLIRQNYWIPQGRTKVQKVLKRCFQCKKHGGGPYRLPQMPELPQERINYTSPFTFTGLDYLGPIMVSTSNERTEKRWICLYTCLAVRAIHLEVVKDLTAEECTLALRRFLAARTVPQLIISDNATQFKLTAEVMTGTQCVENNIKWKFIPELAPWHGGFYERLVGLVKHCLKRSLDTKLIGDNQIYTIIKEIELVLNTRPLTYVSSEPEHILRPIDFLQLKPSLMESSEEPYLPNGDSATKERLIEGWKRGQRMVAEFSKMFINQYLMSLKERKTTRHKQSRILSSDTPNIGDTVQIKGDNNNRCSWKIGKIIKLHKGQDHEVRVATVKIGDKEYTRSIAHLYPLEIQDKPENPEEQGIQEETLEVTNDNVPNLRENRRTAADKAREKIATWTKILANLIFVTCIDD